jgi:hypothetical protein
LSQLDANFNALANVFVDLNSGAQQLANANVATIVVNSNNISADNSLGFRNRIINGDMRIAQRGTAAVTTSGSYAVDRFLIQIDTDGAYSAQQDSDAPTGFIKSTKITTTTADASLSASQYFQIQQRIEGTNTADLAWGSASAKTVTLSFWVRSSLTGTFGGALGNSDFNRSYPYTYTILVADTWEYKTVTIAGDTSGTWKTDTDVGINVRWGLGVGSNFSGTAGAWAGSGLMSATGAVSVIGTLNATWYITGVQLEVGSVATPFERRPYGTGLSLCQRYYWQLSSSGLGGYTDGIIYQGWADTATSSIGIIQFPVSMRTSPTVLTSGTVGDYVFRAPQSQGISPVCGSVPTTGTSGTNYVRVNATTSSTFTVGAGHYFSFSGNTTGFIGFSSEL